MNQTLLQTITRKIKYIIVSNPSLVNNANLDTKTFIPLIKKNKNGSFGDYSLNFLMKYRFNEQLFTKFKNYLIKKIKKVKYFNNVQFTGGYINFSISPILLKKHYNNILKEKEQYGSFKKTKTFYNLEFVSANPTGLLHLGHARGAAYGDSLCRIWKKYGIIVNREYYINDGGNQIECLKNSVFIRYLQLFNVGIDLPEDSYHGEEIIDVAKHLKQKYGSKFLNANHILEEKYSDTIKLESVNFLLSLIKGTLHEFGVVFDIWFHETDIYKFDLIRPVLEELKEQTYQKDGALFLKTMDFGDDKDRVLIKSDGTYTYFTPDIAYHKIKLSRGYDKIFNIWGADHKSYVDRMAIAIEMLGYEKDIMTTLIQQMVRLTKDGQEFKMSKRTGNSITIQDLLSTIGLTASRWFLVSTSIDSHLEIDVNKVTKEDNTNPVFYVEYAYARIKSVLNKNKFGYSKKINLLTTQADHDLLISFCSFKDTIESIAQNYNVHWMCDFLYNFAKQIHSYYTTNKIYDESNPELTKQRCTLILVCSYVLESGFNLIGITPRSKM